MLQSRKNLLFIIALFAAATIFFLARDGANTGIDLTGDALSISGPDDFAFSVPFSEIATIDIVSDYSSGACVSGDTKSKITYGVWENGTLGRHRAYVVKELETCIIISDRNGEVYAVSAEGAETTEAMYAAFIEYLDGQGYDYDTGRYLSGAH